MSGWWIVIVLGFIVAFYLLYVWLEARNEVRSAPRIDMFTCDKHGIYPAKYAFRSNLLPIGEPHEDYKVCPSCLDDAEKAAKARFGLK